MILTLEWLTKSLRSSPRAPTATVSDLLVNGKISKDETYDEKDESLPSIPRVPSHQEQAAEPHGPRIVWLLISDESLPRLEEDQKRYP